MFTGQCQTVAASGDTAGAGLHFPDPARAQAGGGGGQAHAGIHETAAWTLPACRLAGTDAWAALDQPVARTMDFVDFYTGIQELVFSNINLQGNAEQVMLSN